MEIVDYIWLVEDWIIKKKLELELELLFYDLTSITETWREDLHE